MPVRNIFVRDPGCNIKHDDATLPLDVVTVTKSTELFLPGGIPDVEADSTEIGEKLKWMDLHAKSGCLETPDKPKTRRRDVIDGFNTIH